MDKAFLVDSQINEGRLFLEELDKVDFDVKAAFWVYYGEDPTWKLMIASRAFALDPLNEKENPYAVIFRVLNSIQNRTLSIADIEPVSLAHPFVRVLSSVIFTGPGIVRMRFVNTVFNGIFFEDLYVYRMNISKTKRSRKGPNHKTHRSKHTKNCL